MKEVYSTKTESQALQATAQQTATALEDGLYTYTAADGSLATVIIFRSALGLLAFDDKPLDFRLMSLYEPVVLHYLECHRSFGDVVYHPFPSNAPRPEVRQ